VGDKRKLSRFDQSRRDISGNQLSDGFSQPSDLARAGLFELR